MRRCVSAETIANPGQMSGWQARRTHAQSSESTCAWAHAQHYHAFRSSAMAEIPRRGVEEFHAAWRRGSPKLQELLAEWNRRDSPEDAPG